MKKSIILLIMIFSSVFVIGAVKEEAVFEYYSGNKLGGEFQESSIIVEPKSKSYFINMDRIITNQDLEIARESMAVVTEGVENSADPYKDESSICLSIVLADTYVKNIWMEDDMKIEKLDKYVIKRMSYSADKNNGIIKNMKNVKWLYLSKEKSGFQIITMPK